MLHKLKKIKTLTTAVPTREYLDPVRFISNESSGKLGYAIADYRPKIQSDRKIKKETQVATVEFIKIRILLLNLEK